MISAAAAETSDTGISDDAGIAGRPAIAPGLRSLLKEATAQAHHDLDMQFGSFEMSSLSGYRRFLEASASALLPIEHALEDACVATEFSDWSQRSRKAAILSDLAKVGGVARPLPMTQPLNRNSLYGAMYVLEGSRLGAKYMMRGITQSADPAIADATAYLAHGAGQHLWPSFLARLESTPPEDDTEAVEGARMAFALFAEAADRA